MEYMNKNMREMKERLTDDFKNIDKVDISYLQSIISPNIVKFHDCYILDLEHQLNTDNINWKRVMKIHGDRTGYEAACSEVRVNDYIKDSHNIKNDVLIYAFIIMQGWELKLKQQFSMDKFIIILSYDNEYATLRFHKYREEERGWLNNDLDGYKHQAILVREV